jgi:L-ascorbate metabolism protein UlaG (beta-lactamase superfamily)
MILSLVVIAALILIVFLFMQQTKFGSKPSGARLELIQQSPHYKEGKFQNQSHTPDLAEGVTYYSVMKEFFFGKKPRNKPAQILPSKKTDLFSLCPDENVLVWMGHSSYFMQIDGKKILVDPVFSGAASPLSFTTRSFPGADVYSTDDIPAIDILILTHDHWDHMDYATIKKLQPKIKTIITGLGSGAHLERWGFDRSTVIEKDWYQDIILPEEFSITVLPARHFSGRTFSRNNAIWASFALQTPNHKIYIGGDSGYDNHFREIGETYGPFDVAILECGQYNKNWKYIHMMPEETVQAAHDLRAKKLLAVHWAKFALALHPWDEPIIRVHKAAAENNMPLLTPMIGEKMAIDTEAAAFSEWWVGVD